MRAALTIATLAAFTATTLVTPAMAGGVLLARVEAPSANQSFASLFATYPTGGTALASKVSDMIVAKPDIAADLVTYVRSSTVLNAAQKQAAEQGFQLALARLKASNQANPHFPWPVVLFLAALGGLAIYGASSGDHGVHPVSPN